MVWKLPSTITATELEGTESLEAPARWHPAVKKGDWMLVVEYADGLNYLVVLDPILYGWRLLLCQGHPACN